MAVKLLPIWSGTQFFNSAGQVLSGGKIYQYIAGTTTPATTYTDATGITSNANPVILDSAGRYASQFWATTGSAYKLVLQDSTGVTILTEDNLTGVNDTAAVNASEWVTSGLSPSLTGGSGTSLGTFTVPGNQTAILQVGRRLQVVDSGTTYYGTITSSTGTGPTTIICQLDSGTWSSPTVINYALLGEQNPSVPQKLNYLNIGGTSTWASTAQPMFTAHMSANSTPGSSVTFVFDTVDKQQGGTNYANGTGIFTAPNTGWYLFTVNGSGQSLSGTQTIGVNLLVGGASVAVMSGSNSIYGPLGLSYLAYVTATTQVKVINTNVGGNVTYQAGLTFSGIQVA